MYGSNALLYPYQPGYEPHRPYMQASQGFAQPVYLNTGESQAIGSILQHPSKKLPQSISNQAAPTPAPAIAPKPVEPPPTWLRPFLKDDEKGGTAQLKLEKLEEVEADEASPSDLLKPKSKPIKEVPANASDDDDRLTLSPPKSPLERYNEARRQQGSNR